MLRKAEQNSSLVFMAKQRLIPNVSPTALYEFPGANLQRATTTRFSTMTISRRIVFWRTSWGRRDHKCVQMFPWLPRSVHATDDPNIGPQGGVRIKTGVADKPFCFREGGDGCCFQFGSTGLPYSVELSSSVETSYASPTRIAFSFA